MDWVSGRSSVPDLAQPRSGADWKKAGAFFQQLAAGVRPLAQPIRLDNAV